MVLTIVTDFIHTEVHTMQELQHKLFMWLCIEMKFHKEKKCGVRKQNSHLDSPQQHVCTTKAIIALFPHFIGQKSMEADDEQISLEDLEESNPQGS